MLTILIGAIVLIALAIAWQVITVDDAGKDNHYTHYK